MLIFWRDLSSAKLVDGSYASATDDYANAGAQIAGDELNDFLPAAKLGRRNYFTVFSSGGLNYYQLTRVASLEGDGSYTLSAFITPIEASNMDVKMDDGDPQSGIVRAMKDNALPNIAAPVIATASLSATGGDCVEDTGTETRYNTSQQIYADTVSCQLRFRFN